MPITRSAKKALRSSNRKRGVNLRVKDAFSKAVKNVKKTASVGKKESSEALILAYKALDKAAKKGVIKKNTASRKKSRLAKMLKKANLK